MAFVGMRHRGRGWGGGDFHLPPPLLGNKFKARLWYCPRPLLARAGEADRWREGWGEGRMQARDKCRGREREEGERSQAGERMQMGETKGEKR